MKRYTFWRNAVIAETYIVEAENEEIARDMLFNGAVDPVHTEWIDWQGDRFELEEVEELDPLYRMIKDYDGLHSI